MTTVHASVQARWLVVAGLRRWAEGAVTDEAAVELLIGLGARFTHPGCLWIRRCRRAGWYWLYPDPLSRFAGRLSGHERRVLTLIVSLSEEPATLSVGTHRELVSGRAAA